MIPGGPAATATVAAVDLGASSGRVVVGRLSNDPAGRPAVTLHEVHRFANVPVRAGARLRWDVLRLFRGVLEGLQLAARQFGPLDGIGVDSWAVDYGVLDSDGELLGNPISYRDAGTEAAVAAVLADLGPEALYQATGIQLQPFNTLFQLLARRTAAQSELAGQVLLLPDLISYWLSGRTGTELTNASTTQLLDPRTSEWSSELAGRLDVPVSLFAPLRRSGTVLGPVKAELRLPGSPQVITVPSHDTAAAVAGIPATGDDFAFVCTGTWALVGIELPAPVITEAARAANFTNEVGVGGSIRFLRNVTGFWLLQECVRQWKSEGIEVDVAALTEAAAEVPGLRALVDVQNPDFVAPANMVRQIVEHARLAEGGALDTHARIARCILDSMSLAIRQAVREAAALTGRDVRVIHIVGGGVGSPLFCQLVADACQLPVVAGPTEAASWGNVMSQLGALGVVGESLADHRSMIWQAEQPVTYSPRGAESDWEQAEALVAR
jgi:rhamnulokinase